jgi:hypothetical protein
MSAKPLKIAGATALPTNSRKPRREDGRTDGGTASVKRTQGRWQAVGGVACPRELIQPRKRFDAEADLVTQRGRQHRHERHGERVPVPSGSTKTVACHQRSERDELRQPRGATGAPRTREASPPPPPQRRVACNQPKGGAGGSGEESDPPVVVRDGRADHMAKGWAERQREHSTHRGRRILPVAVSSTLLAMAARIRLNEPDAEPSARLSEEPYAGKPHAGICEGGTR